MGAYVLMSIQVDVMFVSSHFSNADNVRLYSYAMLIGFAMTQFIAPITAVMFPTIVKNLALSNKSDPLILTLGVTGAFAGVAAIAATLFPWVPVKILFPKGMGAADLVPWYAWALVPLTLANVLVQNLLARGKFAAVPRLVLVPILYLLTLKFMASTYTTMSNDFGAFKAIILTMGIFNLLLLAVAAWFTWRKPATSPANPASDPGSAAAR
jgi:O-antigen/teichoic acid export membrane protein